MFVLFGTSTKIIGIAPIDGKCSNCHKNELFFYTFQNFFTLFFIPMFPLGKWTSIICQGCGTEFLPETILTVLILIGIFSS
jgi:hypothetical protein